MKKFIMIAIGLVILFSSVVMALADPGKI